MPRQPDASLSPWPSSSQPDWHSDPPTANAPPTLLGLNTQPNVVHFPSEKTIIPSKVLPSGLPGGAGAFGVSLPNDSKKSTRILFADPVLNGLGEMWLWELRRRGLAERTIGNYRRAIGRLSGFVLADFEAVDFVSRVFDRIQKFGLARSTFRNDVAYISSFDGWLYETRQTSLRHHFRNPRVLPRNRELPSDEDVSAIVRLYRRLFDGASAGRAFTRWRNLCLVALMVETGCRVGETQFLCVGDIVADAEGRFGVFIRSGKTQAAERVLPLSDDLAALLLTEAIHRRRRASTERLWLNPRSGKPEWSHTNFYRELKAFAVDCGVCVPVTPHVFRHKFIFDWIVSGGSAFALMARLGHSSPEQTAWYFNQARRLFPHADLAEEFGVFARRRTKKVTRVEHFDGMHRHVEFNLSKEQLRRIAAMIEKGEL